MKNVVMSQSSSQCRNKEGACERRPPVTKWPCPCTDHRCQELPCARAHTREISTPRNEVATNASTNVMPSQENIFNRLLTRWNDCRRRFTKTKRKNEKQKKKRNKMEKHVKSTELYVKKKRKKNERFVNRRNDLAEMILFTNVVRRAFRSLHRNFYVEKLSWFTYVIRWCLRDAYRIINP